MIFNEMQICQYRDWLNLIKNVNLKPHNIKLAHDFYYVHFACEPEKIKGFLFFFKKHLISIRNKAKKAELANKHFLILSHLFEKFSEARDGQSLDNYCFKVLKPEEYHDITSALKDYKKHANKYLNSIIAKLNLELEKEISDFVITGRYKNIFSIYRKCRKYEGAHVFYLKDIFAFRVILNNNSIPDCYRVLDLLCNKFVEIRSSRKDYITEPKNTGYQSIHMIINNIIDGFKLPVEVQIRTKTMDNFAKNGIRAHWLYTKQRNTELISTTEKRVLRNSVPVFRCNKVKKSDVYCLNIEGDIVKLRSNNTVLDYSYALGEEYGNRVNGVLINGKKQRLDYVLNNGDMICLSFGKRINVNEDWLKFVYKERTKLKIMKMLETKERYSANKIFRLVANH